MLSRSPAIVLAVVLSACAPAAAPSIPTAPAAPASNAAPAAEALPPARWLLSRGGKGRGVAWGDGRIEIFGGRRVLVTRSGHWEWERAPSPVRVTELALVPTAHGTALVGLGTLEGVGFAVYRFDDPLGPPRELARLPEGVDHLVGIPEGVVVLGHRRKAPLFLDVETGKPRSALALPHPALLGQTAFRNMREGAAFINGAGPLVTSDGGATFRPVLDTKGEVVRDALPELDGDELLMLLGGNTSSAFVVDPKSGRLGAPHTAPAMAAFDEDPLRHVINGAVLSDHEAIVATGTTLARIDPETGKVLETERALCGTASAAGSTAYVICQDSSHTAELFSLGPGVPLAQRKREAAPSDADLHTSPSGGVLVTGPCPGSKEGLACVRQPDGSWKTVPKVPGLGAFDGIGALADGRAAFIRATYGRNSDPPHIILVAPDGRITKLPPLDFAAHRPAYLKDFEEDTAHVLHFVLVNESPTCAIEQAIGAPAKHQSFDWVTLHDGHGIAARDGQLLASTDAGSSWNQIAAPSSALLWAREGAEHVGETVTVNRAGATIGHHGDIRLGWGPSALPEELPPNNPTRHVAPPEPPTNVLACTSAAAAGRGGWMLCDADVEALLGLETEPKEGRWERRIAWRYTATEEPIALTVTASDSKRASPERWDLAWLDIYKVGARPHRVRLAPPSWASFDGWTIDKSALSPTHAVVELTHSSGHHLVRVDERGHLESLDVRPDAVSELVLGEGGVVAWLADRTKLVFWPLNQAPHTVELTPPHSTSLAYHLGLPSKDRVPLVLSDSEHAFVTIISRAGGVSDPWTEIARMTHPDELPACGAKAKGDVIRWHGPLRRVELDGHRMRGRAQHGSITDTVYEFDYAARFELRLDGPKACVASISTDGLRPAVDDDGKNPFEFVRVDLAERKAEGGVHGAGVELRHLRCTFGPAADRRK